jgi:hypothetical protein
MATARSRITKGRNLQRRLLDQLKDVFGLTDEEVRVPIGAENGPDIVFIQKQAQDRVGLGFEAKNVKSMNIWKALEQARKNTPKDYDEAVVFKRGEVGANKTYICIPVKHYWELRKKLLELENIKCR